MNRKLFNSLTAIVSTMLLLSCNVSEIDTPAEEKPNTINFTVNAQYPALTEEDGTKVTFSGENLVWEGNEQIGILIGNESSASGSPATYSTQPLSTSTPGIFTGTVTLGSFTIDDIHGMVYPYYQGSWIRNNSGLRVVMQVGKTTQVQTSNGVLNGANFPLFSELAYSDIQANEGTYTVQNKAFQWGCSALRFNIYGSHADMASDEVFKTISVKAASKAIVGTSEWKIATDAFTFNGTTGETAVASLIEECTIADKTSANGVVVYMAVLPRGAGITFTEIKITTNKAIYTKTISNVLDISAGNLKRVGLNMANFASREAFTSEYSTDGGSIWKAGTPKSSETFTTLAVRGSSFTAAELNLVKIAIDGQSSPVDLDLSAATYENTTFPTGVFTATAESPNTTLKSIKFPANITAIAAGASNVGAFTYCTALTSVDLSNITTIGRDAFTYSGLTSVTIPNTVTAIGTQAFRWCYKLTSISYDSPVSTGTHIFAFSDTEADTYPDDGKRYGPTTVTIGSSVTSIPTSIFRSNCGVTSVTFAGSPTIGVQAFKNCKDLATITCLSMTPPTPVNADPATHLIAQNAGSNVAAANRQIIVPAGSLTTYQGVALWGGSDPVAEGEFLYSGFTLNEAE